MLSQAGLQFSKETIDCCFVYLLKKSDDLLMVRKSSLLEFVHSVAGKALDFSMTGSRFPLETELVYSSDSEEE